MEREITELFKSIEFLNFAKVDKELSKIKTIDGKLNYLAIKRTEHYDKYEAIISSLNSEQYLYFWNNVDQIARIVFSHWPLQTPLQVPSFIFENHLKEDRYNPTFSNWFIDYNARTFCFEYWRDLFEKNEVNKRRRNLIKMELNEIENFEKSVNELYDGKKIRLNSKGLESKDDIDRYKESLVNFKNEIEYLRIDEGYYNKHYFEDNVFDVGNNTSMILAKHIYYKKYLEGELQKFELESVIEKRQIKAKFKELFETTELYEKALKILIENRFIEENDNELKWISTQTKEFKTNQTIIALCVVLEKKNYFKKNVKAVYQNIENEFNIKIHKSNYSRSSDIFKKDYANSTSNSYRYTSLFDCLL